jgi:hypothetical protein
MDPFGSLEDFTAPVCIHAPSLQNSQVAITPCQYFYTIIESYNYIDTYLLLFHFIAKSSFKFHGCGSSSMPMRSFPKSDMHSFP